MDKITVFIQTLYNMYPSKITKEKLDKYLSDRKITKEEYEYILQKEDK